MKVLVALPHYFKEVDQAAYGSGRRGQQQARSLALIQCLSSLLAMRKQANDLILNIKSQDIHSTGVSNGENVTVDIHLFTNGVNVIEPVLRLFKDSVHLHAIELNNNRHLPLKARDYLLQNGHQYDLCLYMEDDLIIRDHDFLEKQQWLIKQSKNKAVLMPHRTEWVPKGEGQRLLVDGPLKPEFIQRFCTPKPNAARGIFKGREVVFDRTENPHSGLFCISGTQAEQLAKLQQPVDEFVSPLETAATLTVLQQYMVLKPAWKDRDFLWVEHGHPSFQAYCTKWPMVGEPV